MTPTTAKPKKHRQRLGLVLFLVFALAMVMGPGPGLRLVTPAPAAAREGLHFLGMTVVNARGLFRFGVQAAEMVTACFTIWKPSEE